MRLAAFLLFCGSLWAQLPQPQQYVSVDPNTTAGAGVLGSPPRYNYVLHRLWNCQQTSGNACTWKRSDGAGSGTVTVVASGNLISTACVTGGGSQAIQTPSANCTIDSNGNLTVNSLTTIGSSPSIFALTPVLVSALPTCAAPNNGTRASVTDATATAFLSVVVGGGGQNVPVYCDGAVWRIG